MADDITPKVFDEMRAWIEDCEWADLDNADDLTPGQVIAGINKHYAGGVERFLADGKA